MEEGRLWTRWTTICWFFFSSRRRHTRFDCDWSSDVCSSDLVRTAEGRPEDPVLIRPGSRLRVVVAPPADAGGAAWRIVDNAEATWPVLPDAAAWVLPDLELLRAGLIEPGRLHPVVAAALAPGHRPRRPDPPDAPRRVRCRGAEHRIGLVAGVLSPLDHDSDELRREELLVALGGTPLPCLQVIDEVNRNPQGLADIRARLDHGDMAGALAAVEYLLGPAALLRTGPLRDALGAAADRRITYGLYRAGLLGRRIRRQVPPQGRRLRPIR